MNNSRVFLAKLSFYSVFFFFIGLTSFQVQAQNDFTEYKGIVRDKDTNEPLPYVTLSIANSNGSTITNTEGKFALKIQDSLSSGSIAISHLGYERIMIPVSSLKSAKNRIFLAPSIEVLSEIDLNTIPNDAKQLVRRVLKSKGQNYFQTPTAMTAFYRETIKRGRRNVSLSEAVVNVEKQPYQNKKRDVVSLYKSRKQTDYSKLDTLALKLQGGPFNTLYVDLMKYPEYIFAENNINFYDFSFKKTKKIDGALIYVISFKQIPTISYPLYYGELYVDAESVALTRALYSLNITDVDAASKLFVKRKPSDVRVSPVATNYEVNYRQKNGRWYYGYSNVQLGFKINWKRKLFNSTYTLTSEMAVTDWENAVQDNNASLNVIRPNIVIADEASGFSDPEFWGTYNVIEPERSIESAINKIRKQLKRS